MGNTKKTNEQLMLELQILTREHEELKQLYHQAITDRKHDGKKKELNAHRGTSQNHEAIVSATPDGEIQSVSEKLGNLLVAPDITERKQFEEELRVVTEKLYESQEIGNIGSFSYDMAGRVFKPSPHFLKIFGFAPGQAFDAKAWINVVHPDDRQAIKSLVVNCVKRGIP